MYENIKLRNFYAQALRHGLLVFINPSVASLPQHDHLFGGHGCYNFEIDNLNGGINCSDPVDYLPKSYQSLLDCSRTTTSKEKDYNNIPWICQRNKNLL